MQITRVSIEYGRKITRKKGQDFDSADITVGLWADVDAEDDLHEVMAALWSTAKQNVKASLLPVLKGDEDAVKDIFLGLPAEFRDRAEIEVFDAAGNSHLVKAETNGNGEVKFK